MWHIGAAALAMCFALGACQHVENPFRDETIPADAITTATATGIRQHGAEPAYAQRNWPRQVVVCHSGMVTHWPLWWEDPFEDMGSDDHQFAWTWEDGVALPACIGRWMINTAGFPAGPFRTDRGTLNCEVRSP